jgi:hypothetical protein
MAIPLDNKRDAKCKMLLPPFGDDFSALFPQKETFISSSGM